MNALLDDARIFGSTSKSYMYGFQRMVDDCRSAGSSDWRGRQRICHLQVGKPKLARLANHIHCISPWI